MGTIKTTNIEPIADNGTVTLGSSGDTFTVPTGATLDLSNATQTGVGGTNTPAFQALATSVQNISNATQTTVNFDTTVFDTDSAFNTSTNSFVVPSGKGGKYYFYACIRRNSWTSSRCYMSFQKNGSDIAYVENGNDIFQTLPAFITLDLSASDSISLQYYHDNGAPQNLNAGSFTEQKNFFGGYKLIGA